MSDEAPEFDEETIEAGRVLCAGPCTFLLGAASLTQLPEADRPEIAFAGRSNVGKSSLINGLLWRKNLARASSEPGRTRELNYFDLGEGRLWLVDLPGFGYAKVSRTKAQEWQRLTLRYLRGRVNLRRVFLLVDSRRGLMDTDHEVMDMLDSAAVTYQLVLTKTDKIKRTEADAVSAKVAEEVKKRPAVHPMIRQTSAEKGWGLPELRAEIYKLTE